MTDAKIAFGVRNGVRCGVRKALLTVFLREMALRSVMISDGFGRRLFWRPSSKSTFSDASDACLKLMCVRARVEIYIRVFRNLPSVASEAGF